MDWNELPGVSWTISVVAGNSTAFYSDQSSSADIIMVGLPSNSSNITFGDGIAGNLPDLPGGASYQQIAQLHKSKNTKILLETNATLSTVTVSGNWTADEARTVGSTLATRLVEAATANKDDASLSNDGKRWFTSSWKKATKPLTASLVLLTTPCANATLLPLYVKELATSLQLGLYQDDRYKGRNSKKQQLPRIVIQISVRVDSSDEGESTATAVSSLLNSATHDAAKIARGVYLARDIVQAPHNVLNSLGLAHTAKKLAAAYKNHLVCHVTTPPPEMGSFWAVARGSETPPQLIHLIYKGKPTTGSSSCRKLGVIGKGVMFDTGGYNIKTGGMELMKIDCGGAAACLGAALILAGLAPDNVEVHFVVAACENMINERAMVPGDILTASNGKTIEVLNTDAEGRLTMADALVYADKTLQCEEILELSTLTGASVAALGPSFAALFTLTDSLADTLLKVSKETGEKLWRMPMAVSEYGDQIKSKIADLRNLGTGRTGGAITAALFLQEFVDKGKPFAHVDMAGTAYSFTMQRATGFGARLISEWVFACRSKEVEK